MTIDKDTKYIAFAPFEKCLQAGEVDRLKKAAPIAVIGRDGYLSLTIADFNALAIHGDLSVILRGKSELELSVFEWYTLQGLKDFFEGYAKDLEKFAVKGDAKEQRAQAACYKSGAVESMIVFAREYFGLKSFAEAEQVTLAELLLARKYTYNKVMFSKALQAQYNKKGK